jgi:hypothetical protein
MDFGLRTSTLAIYGSVLWDKIMEQMRQERNTVSEGKDLDSHEIQVCGFCTGWWKQEEFPKHQPECQNPYQNNL